MKSTTNETTNVRIVTSELTALSQLDRALLSAINAAKKLGYQEHINKLVRMKNGVDLKINSVATGEQQC